jgi:LmbE family N-acetylglucosaminyl deacetylase
MEARIEKRALLAVLAHPDDESFGMGGTLAKYADDGTKVYLICATRGEAGEVDPEFLEGQSSIAHLREMELRCAVEKLGLREVHILDYRDSGMSGSADNKNPEALINAPLDQVAKEIAEYIRRIKPQVILTFDPIGGYRHPDHIFIHQATTKAFYLAGDPAFKSSFPSYKPEKLYNHTIPRKFIRFYGRLLRLLGKDPSKFGKNKDVNLTQLAGQEFPIHVRINYASVKNKKDAAAACHASQGGAGLTGSVFRWLLWLMGVKPEDQFMQAYPEPDLEQISVKKDLFS